MDTELTPTQLAIEFLRRDPAALTPAQYLKKLKLLENKQILSNLQINFCCFTRLFS